MYFLFHPAHHTPMETQRALSKYKFRVGTPFLPAKNLQNKSSPPYEEKGTVVPNNCVMMTYITVESFPLL